MLNSLFPETPKTAPGQVFIPENTQATPPEMPVTTSGALTSSTVTPTTPEVLPTGDELEQDRNHVQDIYSHMVDQFGMPIEPPVSQNPQISSVADSIQSTTQIDQPEAVQSITPGAPLAPVDIAIAALQGSQNDVVQDSKAPVIDPSIPTVVALEQVSRQYMLGHTPVAAVNGINLGIKQGEFVSIIGPSGSGKSTLLNLIGGLDRPDSGNVIVDGLNISQLKDRELSEFRNRTVGFVFQFFYLQPFLTVRRNIEVPGMFMHLSQAERDLRVAELAEAVGIVDRLDHLPKELSGGQIQRVAIARALLNRPKLLLADEPTGNVDRINADAIMDLFRQVRERYGTTIILVTHDVDAAKCADRLITVSDGAVRS